MSANEKQVAGTHYGSPIQHWDFVVANDLGYFEGQITKYVTRWKKKNGLVDLKKAQHFLEKLIEIEEAKTRVKIDMKFRDPRAVFLAGDPVAMVDYEGDATSAYVNQDRITDRE